MRDKIDRFCAVARENYFPRIGRNDEARHCTAAEHVLHSARTPEAQIDRICTTLAHPAGDEWRAEDE
jgi:hypothetical protein